MFDLFWFCRIIDILDLYIFQEFLFYLTYFKYVSLQLNQKVG